MSKCIMLGIDLHDEALVVKLAEDRGRAETLGFDNTRAGRRRLWAEARRRSGPRRRTRVVMAYEASCQGFGFHDEAVAEGFECYVLAPTKIARSASQRRRKTDEQDAARLLEIVRGHVLAGNELPAVWVPDAQTRDDREITRTRLELAEKLTAVKAQAQMLLKRHRQCRPKVVGRGWTNGFASWLRGLTGPRSPLGQGARVALGTLLRQKDFLEQEIATLGEAVERLAEKPAYAEAAAALSGEKGVGLLTAMVVLTELGNLRRFANRKQIGAYLGLAPSSAESGKVDDRKGHITRQGPWRVRRVLCQCVWARIRGDDGEAAVYKRIAAKNPRHKKIAVVALMRRLGVRLWHLGRTVQERQASVAAAA